jgi:hypothetical protein
MFENSNEVFPEKPFGALGNETAGTPCESSIEAGRVDGDLLCPDYSAVTDVSDINDEPKAPSREVHLSDVGIPPTVTQTHYIDGMAHEGDHPNRVVREAINAGVGRFAVSYDRFNELLDAVPNLNSQYEPEMSRIRVEVAADFGQETADLPVAFLAPEQYEQVFHESGTAGGEAAGTFRHGRVLICVEPEIVERYGSRPLKRTLSHEYSHGSALTNDWAITSRPARPGDEFNPMITIIDGYAIQTRPNLGLSALDGDITADEDFIGTFLEEGAAENYALLKEQSRDPEWARAHDGLRAQNLSLDMDHQAIVSYANCAVRLVHPSNGTVTLPWRYAVGTFRGDNGLIIAHKMNALPAYGIHLLEKYRLPGLHAQLMASRTDSALRPLMRERINSVSTDAENPLYQQLTRLHYTPTDLLKGLKIIIKTLGIENEPVQG